MSIHCRTLLRLPESKVPHRRAPAAISVGSSALFSSSPQRSTTWIARYLVFSRLTSRRCLTGTRFSTRTSSPASTPRMLLDSRLWAASSTVWERALATHSQSASGAWPRWGTRWRIPSQDSGLHEPCWDSASPAIFPQLSKLLQNGFPKENELWRPASSIPEQMLER